MSELLKHVLQFAPGLPAVPTPLALATDPPILPPQPLRDRDAVLDRDSNGKHELLSKARIEPNEEVSYDRAFITMLKLRGFLPWFFVKRIEPKERPHINIPML